MINKIIDFCSNFWSMLINFFDWVADGILYIQFKILYLFMDVFFSLIESIVTSIDLSFLSNSYGNWDVLPSQTIYILSRLHITTCLLIISGACFIRLTLNLIPASLTRV